MTRVFIKILGKPEPAQLPSLLNKWVSLSSPSLSTEAQKRDLDMGSKLVMVLVGVSQMRRTWLEWFPVLLFPFAPEQMLSLMAHGFWCWFLQL